jgi:hypothetical protein
MHYRQPSRAVCGCESAREGGTQLAAYRSHEGIKDMPKHPDRDYPQEDRKHPDAYEGDLNPHRMAGQNIGGRVATVPAADLKDVVSVLADAFTIDELRQIPIVVRGTPLEQGAKYVDLADDERREMTAMGGMTALSDQWLVPKQETPPAYWNRLIGRSH